MLTVVYPPVPPTVIACLQACLQGKDTRLIAESGIVFVCGARARSAKSGPRDRLLQYAKKRIKGFEFFMAEDVFEAVVRRSRNKIDLLALEKLLADYSDCIIMILETPSVFAELGSFTADDAVTKKILAINDSRFKDEPSFVNLGPLAKIETQSDFRPVIYADLRSILMIAPEIERRLSGVRRRYEQRVDLSSFDAFRASDRKHQLLFLHDLLSPA